jgi:hypothetical protein
MPEVRIKGCEEETLDLRDERSRQALCRFFIRLQLLQQGFLHFLQIGPEGSSYS